MMNAISLNDQKKSDTAVNENTSFRSQGQKSIPYCTRFNKFSVCVFIDIIIFKKAVASEYRKYQFHISLLILYN